MNLSQEKQGEIIIFSEAILWGLFPVITILSFKNISPLISLAWSTFFATIFFAIVLSIKNKWPDTVNKKATKDILITTLILGIAFYVLFFTGLHYTSAGNASIIALTEVFFSFLFFNIWQKDFISTNQIIGAISVLIGAIIILYPNFSGIHLGDFLILSAASIAPFGNFFQRRARKIVCSESILFIRCLISTPIIFLLALISGDNFLSPGLNPTLVFLILNGVFVFGISKILWIEGIHRISVTKAVALSCVAPLFALLFAWLLLGNIPTSFQLLSLLPMTFGVILLSKKK